eukprot:scaffold64077_cov69-Phaeocystis_antarctica.AAC.2
MQNTILNSIKKVGREEDLYDDDVKYPAFYGQRLLFGAEKQAPIAAASPVKIMLLNAPHAILTWAPWADAYPLDYPRPSTMTRCVPNA